MMRELLKSISTSLNNQHQQQHEGNRRRFEKGEGHGSLIMKKLISLLVVSSLLLIVGLSSVVGSPVSGSVLLSSNGDKQQQQQTVNEQATQKAKSADKDISAFQAELNSLVHQHDGSPEEANQRKLAEIIISRLMLDNLIGSSGSNDGSGDDNTLTAQDIMDDIAIAVPTQQAANGEQAEQLNNDNNSGVEQAAVATNQMGSYDALRSRKFWNMIQQINDNANLARSYNQLSNIPGGSESATMKRAAQRYSNYLHQQRQGYLRNNFDFGLGKRPDDSVSVLRYGDSLSGGSGRGVVSGVGQLGKRPSTHRFDFGLGKRLASPTYPRYDFGLGKRAPSRIRYDFGLGK